MNYKIKLFIKPNDIYNKLSLENQNRFSEVKIVNANLLNDGVVEIECLALENPIMDYDCRYRLFGDGKINL